MRQLIQQRQRKELVGGAFPDIATAAVTIF
jgi:hypothetical protein